MKLFFTKKSTTRGKIVVVVESKAAKNVVIRSFNPEFEKKCYNFLLDKLPTRIENGVEILAL
jgi:hypothetical protein